MALQDVTMPAMGADMTEGTVVKWLKSEGDTVSRGDKLAEIETDKTVVEMESYVEGTLRKIILGDGAKVPVGTLLAYVGDPSEQLPADVAGDGDDDESGEVDEVTAVDDASEVAEIDAPEVATEMADSPTVEVEAEVSDGEVAEDSPSVAEAVSQVAATDGESDTDGRVKASPLARRLAREAGYDIAAIAGTGPGGRITRDDVLAYIPEPEPVQIEVPVVEPTPETVQVSEQAEEEEAEPLAASDAEVDATASEDAPEADVAAAVVRLDGSDIELTTMRQAIARVTTRSMTEAPHYYVTTGIDMTQAMSIRGQYNAELADSGDRVSVNDMIIKALAQALVKYPKWNAFYGDGKLEGHADINIGVAIALEAGLIVPALIGVQSMSLVDVSRAAKDLGGRARGDGGTLTQEELTAGTFSTSNLGMFDIDVFSAIIVPPQAGILAVGAAKPTPVVRDGEIVIRTIMNATISADHRVGDGAEAAALLNEVKSNLERPLRLIL